MKPSGIEYSQTGMEATIRNFELLNLPVDEILTGDFFAIKGDPRFDLVMSFGFIEHFDDPNSVIDRHLDWVKPGGKLVLGVPNFNGIYRPIQQILDPSLLDKHNLSIMNLDYFRGLEKILPISLKSARYIGSFEPNLPIAKDKPHTIKQILVKIFLSITNRIRKLSFFDNLNHPLISSYIIVVFTKN
jgi:SAM-dependent methyltransferase